VAQDTSLRGGKSRPEGAKISPGGAAAPCPPTSRAYDNSHFQSQIAF